MKKSITLIAVVFTTLLYAQVPSYVPTNGLIGYWPFNGNANDVSGHNFNGVATGVTPAPDRNGTPDSSYSFTTIGWAPGTQLSEVYIQFDSSFYSPNITVSAWINPFDSGWLGSMGMIIARVEEGYSTPRGECWGMAISTLDNPLNNKEFHTFLLSQTPNTIHLVGNQLILNQWSHVVLSFDGNLQKQYINGILTSVDTVPDGFILNQEGTSGISIGVSRQANGFWQPFNGLIDDVGYWNRALSEQEVSDVYNGNPTSIDNVSNTTSFLYPNPTTNQLNVLVEGAAPIEINIYNTNGTLVKQAVNAKVVDVAPLAAGIYIAEIKAIKGTARHRWVKI